MPTLTVLRGLPGSGKSSLARAHLAASPRGTCAVICRDTLREHVFGCSMGAGDQMLPPAGEDAVTAMAYVMVEEALLGGIDVIVDATHLAEAHVIPWRALADEAGAHLEVVDLQVGVEECVRRDAARAATGGRHVGRAVIEAMAEKGGPVQ